MKVTKPSDGTVHKIPRDLMKMLTTDEKTVVYWNTLTPLARNEFICWVEHAKADETRTRRIQRTIEELHEGKRRPCCWPGCVHRPHKSVRTETHRQT